MRIAPTLAALATALLCSCSSQPAMEPEEAKSAEWRLHCETNKTFYLDLKAIPGVYHGAWVWGEHSPGDLIHLKGEIDGGFFIVQEVVTESGQTLPAQESTLRRACLETIAEDEPRDLARVLAARDSRDLSLPLVYPQQESTATPVTRLVVFGDSLSDAGRIKHRLQIFPGKPYWLGRFSNGPVWPDYMDEITDLAIQNRSFGGASINPPHDIDEAGLLGFIKDEGRFFVSGSLNDQTELYLQSQQNPAQINNPDNTAYLVWAGANDYISKEPITGLITTLLNTHSGENSYRTVAEDTVAGILEQVRTLYRAGGRRFLVVNLPDLGLSPIVLQNDSYLSGRGMTSDTARRIEFSHRLSRLTDYHNEVLAAGTASLQAELTDAQIRLLDSNKMTDDIFKKRSMDNSDARFDYGFALDELSETLEYKGQQATLQQACYSGAYLGTLDSDDICDQQNSAFFWDVIHPATLAHCWQAYVVADAMADAGWIPPARSVDAQRDWCHARIDRLIR